MSQSSHYRLRVKGSVAGLCLSCVVCFATQAEAGFWGNLIRRTAKSADDVPLRQTDEVADRLARSGTIEELLDGQLRRSGKISDQMDNAARRAAQTAEIGRRLNSATEGLDPAILKRLDELDEAARGTALILAEGGRNVARVIPDLGTRARFLESGGVETVAGVGMFGDVAVKDAMRLDAAIRAGKVASPNGLRPVTVADFGRLLTTKGDAAWTFWGRYVRPHWKLWLGGGALAAFLVAPDDFMDSAANLTEDGFRRLTERAGQVAATAIRGTASGTGKAVEDVTDAVVESYFTSWKGVTATIGTVLFLSIVLPRPRRFLWRVGRKVLCTQSDQNSQPGDDDGESK